MNRTSKGWTMFLALALALGAGLNTASVSADSGAATYEYYIGSGVVCSFGPSACPAVAMTAPGETLHLTGSGTLSIHPNSVTGGGDATHYFIGGGSISGYWLPEQLLSFTEYGCGDAGSPANYCGGQAVIRIGIYIGGVNVVDGTLKVESRRGAFPAGTIEGMRFAAQGRNFNKIISGSTLFIKQP
ncbi:MAG: hypothetical protein ABI847_12395 [Anaerolineales bacterium]